MSKIQVICSPFLVDENELHDAAKEAADAILSIALDETRAAGDVSIDVIRQGMDLPTWVGIPPELVNAVRHEILNRISVSVRRLGDYCPS